MLIVFVYKIKWTDATGDDNAHPRTIDYLTKAHCQE